MKRFVLMPFVLTAIVGCGQKSSTEESRNPETDQINQYVNSIADSLACYCYVNSNADSTKQVSVIYRQGTSVMVTTSSSVMPNDEMYVLSDKDGSVVYMRETVTDPINYVKVENRFYYKDRKPLKAETKSDTGRVALCNLRFVKRLSNASFYT
ncbi:MAG: hypothetical protein LBG19_04390 [Prevotellaceae bacterium]|jgi:hypothetical protein|nr:hypothetical protein [Prevotellaceae bacterium]